MPNSDWNYSLGPYSVAVDTVSGTGTITFTFASGSSGPLGTNATYTPPNGTVPNSNGGNLGGFKVSPIFLKMDLYQGSSMFVAIRRLSKCESV